jgi:hypothetical protein
MRAIWKFPLPTGDGGVVLSTPVKMPEGAIIRHFEVLMSGRLPEPSLHPTIWAEVDTEAPQVARQFVTVGTGHPLRNVGAYVGTYPSGPFVWHIYEDATQPWTDWPGGECPVLGFVVVDIEQEGQAPWSGPASAADWSEPLRYRISDEQPQQ